ncbi:hypothetical protein [Hasllibacter sp. MH4015]|uniref:hypothetical protein n=1 Tax=Hasllibacter sp. MH4015 TaxID=2854029 RepID=UPI001CD75C3A|nr:hypothetical protein [Hasllibacter sp. MH4015]
MIPRKLGMCALLIVTGASTASAQVANGRYQIGTCTTHPEETVVRLENNVLTFYESVCTLANPQPIDGTDGFSYVGNCAGEGQEWQANMLLIPLQDGQVMRMIRDGIVLDYQRCTP